MVWFLWRKTAFITVVATLLFFPVLVKSEKISLEQALARAVRKTARGAIIDGNLEVSQQKYFAEKINYYLPEISINGSVPSYKVTNEYSRLPASEEKANREVKRLSFNSDITLTQNLITGGNLSFTTVLTNSDNRESLLSGVEDDKWKFGTFDHFIYIKTFHDDIHE